MVYILRNVKTGETAVLSVNGSYTLGRSQRNNILLRNVHCTRKHAVIEIKNGYATISDVGSKRGTFVNKVKIQDETKLQNGDVILFGLKNCVYKFIDPQFNTFIDKTIPKNIKLALQEALKELDVTVLDNYSKECSYYVTESITLDELKNSRLFDAVVDQKPVVTPNFWIDMFKNINEGVEIPNKYRYTPKIEDSVNYKGFQYIVPKLNRKQLFLNKLFIFFDPGLVKHLEHLIWKCGGRTMQFNDKPDFATSLTEKMDFHEAIIITEERLDQLPLTVTYFMDKLRQCDRTVRQMSKEDIYIAVLKGHMEKISRNEKKAQKKAVEKEIFSDSSEDHPVEIPKQPTTSKKSSIKQRKKSLEEKVTTISNWVWRSKKGNTTPKPGGSKDAAQGRDEDVNLHKSSKDKTKEKEKDKSKSNVANESKFDTSLSMSSSSDDETNIEKKELPKNTQKRPGWINIKYSKPIDKPPPNRTKEKQEKLPEKENRSQQKSVYILDLPDSPIRIINVDSESEEMPLEIPPQTKSKNKATHKKNGQHPEEKNEATNISDSPDNFKRKTKQSRMFVDADYCALEDSEEFFKPVSKKVNMDRDSDETMSSLEDKSKPQGKKLKLNPFATTKRSSTPKPKKGKKMPNIQKLNKIFTDVDFLPV